MSERRRYVVKAVASSPAWSGTMWAVGCVHLVSAERLFRRKATDESWDGGVLLLIDRLERRVLEALGTHDPVAVARHFGEDVV